MALVTFWELQTTQNETKKSLCNRHLACHGSSLWFQGLAIDLLKAVIHQKQDKKGHFGNKSALGFPWKQFGVSSGFRVWPYRLFGSTQNKTKKPLWKQIDLPWKQFGVSGFGHLALVTFGSCKPPKSRQTSHSRNKSTLGLPWKQFGVAGLGPK